MFITVQFSLEWFMTSSTRKESPTDPLMSYSITLFTKVFTTLTTLTRTLVRVKSFTKVTLHSAKTISLVTSLYKPRLLNVTPIGNN